MKNQLFEVTPAGVLADPSASYWLKNAISDLLKRDPVDAMNDASALAEIMRGHCLRVLKS